MKERLKPILRNAWNEPRHFFFWLTLISALGLVAGIALNDSNLPASPAASLAADLGLCRCRLSGGGDCRGVVGFPSSWIPPIRGGWPGCCNGGSFCWPAWRTLWRLFYTVENWRRQIGLGRVQTRTGGERRTFRPCQNHPPPVPDEQNFAMAPIVMTTYSWILDRNGRKIPNDTNVVRRFGNAN